MGTSLQWQICCVGSIKSNRIASPLRDPTSAAALSLQVYPYEYDLVLQPDINTRGHTQWYYFAVANTRAGVPYRFNVINLLKEDSLYNMGMLPLMHSEQQMRLKVSAQQSNACVPAAQMCGEPESKSQSTCGEPYTV